MGAGSKCCNDGWVCKCDMNGGKHGFSDIAGIRVPNKCRCPGCGPCRSRRRRLRKAARRARRKQRG